jgi:hypothetical protein
LRSRDGDGARRVAQRWRTTSIDFAVFTWGRNTPPSPRVRIHALEVAIELAAIEHERGCFQSGQLHQAR